MTMNSYYFTFGDGQPHHPGYVQVIAPDRITARHLMVEEYGRKWAGQYEALEDVHTNDRIKINEIVYSVTAGDTQRWPCDICKTWRLDSKVDVMQEMLTIGHHDMTFNVKYCADNLDCREGVKGYMNRLTEKVLGAVREVS
ncbi:MULTISPECIES: hypothetical protein [Endozoicomonas]|uniref:hypothetical protein n=1 Tax=Endozoicomonas TaxID=305899 RepID=UPI000825266C|nr:MULTISPECIES: hypothetical protein [Endozoicomonas]USE36840.1 hypothetical protein MJO57_00935 [Endozoicomonas sp. SCSIO W0465]